MTPEQLATQRVRLSASSLGLKLFRNNSGGFYDAEGRFVRFGLGNESKKLNDAIKFGDYVGVMPVTITPEMVGKTIGVFANVEIKPDGTLESTLRKATSNPKSREGAQLKGINLVQSLGGVGFFATNENDVMVNVANFLEVLKK